MKSNFNAIAFKSLRREVEADDLTREAAELDYQDFVQSARVRLADTLGVEVTEITDAVLNYLIADEAEDSIRATWEAKPWTQCKSQEAATASAAIQQIQRHALGL